MSHLNRVLRLPWPLTWPANFGRKPSHFVSGKVISDSGNIPLRPHDMTRIAHTEIGTGIVPQKPPCRALATGRASHMPARASDQRVSTRPVLYIHRLDRSFAGRRDEKTFTIRGESAAASEGRRYIIMDKSMYVSRAAYVCLRAHSIQCAGFSPGPHGQCSRSPDSVSVCVGRTPIWVKYSI